MWCFTASQAGRPSKDQKKKVDLEHVADSMHKVRVADLVIKGVTLNFLPLAMLAISSASASQAFSSPDHPP
jgi:hypothetical protein